jgi:serine/threonine protein kinase
MGSVYYGVRRSDQVPVALKFFGYTHRAPSEESIREEIRVMMALKNVDGVVHLHGTFLDSATGYIEGKRFPVPRPVLVMDFLEGYLPTSLITPDLSLCILGGDLCDRIMQMSSVSENDLANIFRQILLALQGIHDKGYIHRDLKLENIMMLNQNPDSPIRLIDFGMMVELPPDREVAIAKVALGTAGYIAPESLLRKEYSFKSDVWQAGCCLYNLLSGHFPFNPDNPAQVCDSPFFPMVGEDWARISDSAKKLVESMLEKDPKRRPSIQSLLSHPWLVGETASQTDLGKRYSMRIKNLSLRRKLKRFFVNNDLNLANQRKKLEAIVPALKTEGSQRGPSERSPLDVFSEEPEGGGSISQEKLDTFQNLMMNALQGAPAPRTHFRSTPSGRLLSERPKKEVNYEKFCSVLRQADLPELANESVFAIFDSNNTGPRLSPSRVLISGDRNH